MMDLLINKMKNILTKAKISKLQTNGGINYVNTTTVDDDVSRTVDTYYPYGYGAVPPIGNPVLLFSACASPVDQIAFPSCAGNGKWRFSSPSQGEVQIGNPVKGTYIYFSNDGNIYINGDIRVSGNVYDSKGSLDQLRQAYSTHIHNAPSGPTGPPQQPLGANDE